MNPLALLSAISPRAWLEVGAAVAIASAVAWAIHHERDVGRHEIQVQWDADRARMKAEADKAQAANDAESARRIETLKEIERDSQDKVAAARDAASAATDSALRLQQRFAAAARSRTAPGNPAAAASSASAPAASDLLADVFNRIDDAAGQLAAYADAARIAGAACERSYDALGH